MANIETLAADTRYFAEAAAPSTPSAGQVVTYAKSDGLVYSKDDAGVETAMSHGAWTAYTPTWTCSSGSAPAIGNGTLTGRYKKLDANTYLVQVNLVAGSTTTFGSGGDFEFALPSITAVAGRFQLLTAWILDSGSDHKLAVALVAASATKISPIVPEGGVTVTNSVPMTWATGDQIGISGIIEV